ncbi:2-amino-4-hydroxy-6-hydroxymethyldihydropteridine diphosphokinase [Fulvivirgaceae bacterium BMA10]|uniref:2-amino-4-hydroxy-6-hydroxymethyldihydropteridine pyrophosphokinase n=1 Tax=Splendidivirga corallicola TaxID=3051826 RepID=A0ABT8KJF8_9BACT|nr:2-amino-4-hydroxy-6-hydroxymethyldihydropteridine diphosphokinase [Fulvivirgaceae bacterium BMA10]
MNLYFWGYEKMDGIYLLLGTNQGDKPANIKHCLMLIERYLGPITKKSSLYRTDAWGGITKDYFLNMVVCVNTEVTPHLILDQIKKIEGDIGRVRFEKWGDRIIDVDLLYYYDEVIITEDLQVPHPEIQNRLFTLVPLVEIASEQIHPLLQKTNRMLLETCPDELQVELA